MDRKWIIRILCAILAAVMLLGIIPFASLAAGSSDVLQAELDRAEALGIDMEKIDQDTVTGQEMTRLLDHLVHATDADKLAQWKALIPEFRSSTDAILRYDAMVAVSLAAEVLDIDQLNNNQWYEVHSTIGEKCWDSISFNESLFPGEDAGRPAMDWELVGSAYFYSYGRYSLFSGKYLFDYDEVSNSMRTDEELTYQEAVLAVVRMFDSVPSNLSAEREETEVDEQILAAAKAKYEQILNTESDWTLGEGGKIYYVSPNGDDNNDGLSPETAWQTLGKVNSAALEDSDIPNYFLDEDGFPEFEWAAENRDNWADLNPEDVVLFERGGLWRGMLRTKSGVTYSAYGKGPKPEIWGSPENGAGAEKWSLMPGTDNIWVFHAQLQDCGGILLGEDTVAIKKMAFWDDESRTYLDVGNDQQFENDVLENAEVLDLTTLPDLYFFNYIEYANPVNNLAPEYGAYGTLYLRCDAGNPGTIYDSIEFFTGNNNWNQNLVSTANGVTLDNISFRYGSAGISMQGYSNATARNCCILWVGGITLSYEVNVDGETMARNGVSVSRTGDGIMAGGTNNSVKNCYITQSFDWAVTVEEYSAGFVDGVPDIPRENVTVSDNLIEYCGGGILVVDWYAMEYCVDAPTFTNVTIENNQILYSAMTGWAHIEDYEKGGTYLAALGIYANPGVSGVRVNNNAIYISDRISRLVNVYTFDTGEETVSFAGNTYVQQNFTEMLYYEKRTPTGDTQYTSEMFSVMNSPDAADKLREMLHEQGLTVALPSIKAEACMAHDFDGTECTVCGEPYQDPAVPTDPEPTDPADPDPTDPTPTDPEPTKPDPTEPEIPEVEGTTRLAGENRLITSYLVADMLKEQMGVEKFSAVIVASGGTFADALPGSYLSAVKNAPILLTLARDRYVTQTADYIKANLVSGGTVYILGGESAVPKSMETALAGFNVQRVAGSDRFGTNLEILKTAGVKAGDEILVCEAKGYADSLSASAVGKPILLVYKKLTDAQKAYLATLSNCKFTIVGGTTAVPEKLAKEIEAYGAVTRLAGKDRLETSTMVAEKYFGSAKTAVVAYGWDFPDGLCGGSLAYTMKAPLILTHSKTKLYSFTAAYTTKAGITDGFVLGGDGLVSDEATKAIFGNNDISILK